MTTAANAARRMMVGSEGKLDYLILSDREGTGIGIKVLLSGSRKTGVVLGLRVRASLLPSTPYKGTAINWKQLWPDLQWEEVGSKRARTTLLCPSGLYYYELKPLKERLPAMIQSLLGFLMERIGEFDISDTAKYIHEQIDPGLDAAIAAADEAITYDGTSTIYAKQLEFSVATVSDTSVQLATPKAPFLKLVGGTDHQKHPKHDDVSVDDDEDSADDELDEDEED